MIHKQASALFALFLAPFLYVPVQAATPDTVPSAKLTAEAFGKLPYLQAPQMSPDGKWIAWKSVSDGETRLVLTDPSKPDFGMKQIGLPKNVSLLWARWAGSDKVLMSFLVPDRLFGRASRLFLFDVSKQTVTRVTTKVRQYDADDVIHIDPAGKFILLSGAELSFEYPSVWRIDLDTLDIDRIVLPRTGVWTWFADREGVVRGGVGVGYGSRWWLLYRDDKDADFRRIDASKLQKAVERSAEGDEVDIEYPIFRAGSDQGYVVADTGTGRYGLYRYDFAGGTIGEAVFEHPEVDLEDVSFSRLAGDVNAILYTDDRDRIHWLDPEMKLVQAEIDRAFPDAVNSIVSIDDSGSRMLVHVMRPNDPSTYYLFEVDRMNMRPLAKPHASLAGKPLATMQPVSFKARDGLEIPAYLTLPPGREAKDLPLVMMPHGGPFARDKWDFDPWGQFLASRGYAVLQPNFRGSTGYGRAFVKAGEGEWGRKMQDDLDDGVRWLVEQGTVDPTRVCIMGASYGGYAAMWAAARNPDIYRCAISFAGISDVDEMLDYDRELFVARRYYKDWRNRVRGDRKFDLDTVSALQSIDRVSIPLLIAHGDADMNVPVEQSIRLHKALEKAGKPHEYVIYKGEGHGFAKEENSIDFLKRVERFLAAHNPAD